MISMTFRSGCRSLLVAALMINAVGCGGGDGTKPIANLVPCSGTVTLDGAPLNHGSVAFDPMEKKGGQAAVGAVKNGKFVMLTTVSAPGVVVGRYRASIQSIEERTAVSTDPADMMKRPASLVPAKYTDIATSGLQVEVAKGMTPVTLELKSK